MEELNNRKYIIPLKMDEYNPEFEAVGIDLGTTECCAAVIRKNGVEVVQLDPIVAASHTMPSFVVYDEAHDKCGQIAVNRLRTKSKYTVFDSKRFIGKDFKDIIVDPLWPFNVTEFNDKVQIELADMQIIKSAEEVSGALLKHIKQKVDEFQGKIHDEVVIAIPSTFTPKQTNATITAAKIAGFHTINFIPEPIAAAFAYCTKMEIKNNSKILLFDCGGGTIDVCVAEVINDQLNVLNYNGDSYLGGRDYDTLLFNHFHAVLKHKHNIDVMASSKKYALMEKCKEIKCTLSVEEKYWLDVDDYDPENEEDIIPITRDEFEKMAESYKVRITKVIFQSILKAKLTKEQIEYVFQVGGGCRMPMIKQLLLSTFPNANHQCNLYPDWVVAHGATLYAYHLENLKRNQQTKKYKIPSQCETYDPTFNAVGIDFGTTECCAAVVRKDGPYSILLDTCINLNRVMPLYVSFAEGQALFGQLVINRMKYFAKNSVFDIQKIIGKDFEEIVHNSLWPFKLVKNKEKVFIEVETVNGRENKSPEEIISLILEHVKTKIETFQDLQKFSRAFHVVLAIPFSYSERQKLSLQRAAVMAGFNSINFIPASIAAAFAYCAKNNILDQSNILICECEEGSTELCIAKMDTNEFEILSYENDSHLGGEDFDRLLFNHFDAILKRKYEINVTRTNAKYDLNQICRKIRHELFFRNEAWLHLDDFIFDNEEQIKITREDSENMSAELLLKIKRIINRVVLKANVSKESIRYVFHVGGGCQMPMIKNLLLDTFQMAYHKFHEYPEEVVAHGAALYAYHLQRSKIERGF